MVIALKPLLDEPAMVVENKYKVLVLADLHLGIEVELRQKGINIGSQTDNILERAISCVKAVEPDLIFLLGDIKHVVPQISFADRREVPFFFAQLADYAPIYVVKGNHDGQIEKLLPAVEPKHGIYIKGAQGFLFDHVGYTHGHSWPLQDLFSAQYILIGHNHPMIRLVSSFHTSMKTVWICAQCDYDAVKTQFPGLSNWNAPRVIIMPAFNELCGGVAFNSTKMEFLGPIASKLIRFDTMKAYLLDGTYIGKVSNLDE